MELKLEDDADFAPVTGGPSFMGRGLRRQSDSRNFLFELLNWRWAKCMVKAGLPPDTRPDAPFAKPHVLVDVRQAPQHQLSGGMVCLLQKSYIFSIQNDRALTAEEHFF